MLVLHPESLQLCHTNCRHTCTPIHAHKTRVATRVNLWFWVQGSLAFSDRFCSLASTFPCKPSCLNCVHHIDGIEPFLYSSLLGGPSAVHYSPCWTWNDVNGSAFWETPLPLVVMSPVCVCMSGLVSKASVRSFQRGLRGCGPMRAWSMRVWSMRLWPTRARSTGAWSTRTWSMRARLKSRGDAFLD